MQRVDDTPQHKAVREAFTNAIIHADLMMDAGILRVEKHDDRLCFRNPGLLRLPIEQIYEGGNSKARNPRIQNMLRMVGFGENIGSGFPKIIAAWKETNWGEPELKNKIELLVKVFLPILSIHKHKSENMETESGYKTRESFINDLAFAMSNHEILEDQYLNLTQQNLSVIQREDYSWGKKWPAEGDEVIFVDKTPSWEAFHQMEEFADSITDNRITRQLYNALNKRHPFSAFRYAAEQTGVIQQWYQWRDHWQNEQAEEWMRENGVDFKDGRIVADGKHTHIWSWEDEEDY